jgi:hypothetical protein
MHRQDIKVNIRTYRFCSRAGSVSEGATSSRPLSVRNNRRIGNWRFDFHSGMSRTANRELTMDQGMAGLNC